MMTMRRLNKVIERRIPLITRMVGTNASSSSSVLLCPTTRTGEWVLVVGICRTPRLSSVKATFPTDRGDVIVRLGRVDCIDVPLHHRADPYTSTIVRPPGEATFCSPLKSLPQ